MIKNLKGMYFVLIILLLSLVLGGLYYLSLKPEIPEGTYDIARTVRYGYTISNRTNKVVNNAEFWVYAPVKQTATQKVVNLNASIPFETKEDSFANQVMHFKIPLLAPYGSKVISITAELQLSSTPNPWGSPAREDFMSAEKFIEVDAPKIKEMAAKLTQSKTEPASALFQWVSEYIKFSQYIRDDLGALYAINEKKGDCTESAYLFTALARATQMPARSVGGFVYDRNAVLKSEDYHNWAEYYDGNTWRLSDPQKKVFDRDYSHYIAMRIITKAEDSLLQSSHRFSYSSPAIRVSMN